jgi:hypothetical protein
MIFDTDEQKEKIISQQVKLVRDEKTFLIDRSLLK